MLEVNERKLRKELAEVEKRLESRDRAAFTVLETVARCLHWLGESEAAAEYFLRAAADRESRPYNAWAFLGAGNYYRLAGHHERARENFEQAYELFNDDLQRTLGNESKLEMMIDCGYLLSRYEEVEILDEKSNQDFPTARLARARRTDDARAAREVAEEFASIIRKYREQLTYTRQGLHPWDRYELALQAITELGGTIDDSNESGQKDPLRKLTKVQVQHVLDEDEEDQDLTSIDLSGIDLSNMDFTNALLNDSDLRNANFSNAVFIETNLQGADLRGANLDGALLQQAILSGANLEGVRLDLIENRNLTYVDLSETKLEGFDLRDMDLRRADLTGANLRSADLTGADLRGARLADADLTKANLRGAKLEGADFEGAIMCDILL